MLAADRPPEVGDAVGQPAGIAAARQGQIRGELLLPHAAGHVAQGAGELLGVARAGALACDVTAHGGGGYGIRDLLQGGDGGPQPGRPPAHRGWLCHRPLKLRAQVG